MQPDSWLARWHAGQTGFHQGTVDRHLQAHWPRLSVAPGSPVLVPMCGKSLDVAWLRNAGCSVVGIDISLIAIEALLQESAIPARRSDHGARQIFRAPGIMAVCGDFFSAGQLELGRFAVVYDRAAFGAMAPEYRAPYVDALLEVTAIGSRILMTLLEYPQHETAGPPFSIDADELHRRLGAWFGILSLDRTDILDTDARMQARGVTRLQESCWLLERRR